MTTVWKKTIITVSLSLSFLVAASAAANAESNPPANIGGDQSMFQPDGMQQGAHHHSKHKNGMMMGGGVHQQEYMLLLAEKYTPQSLNAWKAAFQERNKLMEEIRKLSPSQREECKDMDKKSMDRKSMDKKSMDGKSMDGKSMDEKSMDRMEAKGNNVPGNERTVTMGLFEQFTQAVKSGKAEDIRAVMPKMLEHTTNLNQKIAARLQEVKKTKK